MANREENLKKINVELEQLSDEELEKVAGGFYARSKVGDVKPDVEDKNYKAHEDAIKKIPPITITPIPMIPITQPISPPKMDVKDKNYKAHEDAIKKIPPITIIPIPMIPIT